MSCPPFTSRLAAAWAALRGQLPLVPGQPVTSSTLTPVTPPQGDEALLESRASASRWRLAAEESAHAVAALRREMEAERAQRIDAEAAALSARLEGPLSDAAGTLGQLALQARLIEEGKPVTSRDVMALTQNLSRAFAALGLNPAAAVGDAVTFDPALHQPLGGAAPTPGSAVTIRLPGYRLGGRLLRKSFIEATA